MIDFETLIANLENGLVALNNKMHQQRGALSLAKQLYAEQQKAAANAVQPSADPLPTLAGGWLSEEPPAEPGGQIGAPDANR